MVEFYDFAYEHRKSVTTVIGTTIATILPPVPPQQNYEITEVVAVPFGGGSVSGRLMQFATLQGYSGAGTTAGTIVEPFCAPPLNSFIDGDGDAPIAYVSSGNLLYGIADFGSCQVKIVYRPIYKRG